MLSASSYECGICNEQNNTLAKRKELLENINLAVSKYRGADKFLARPGRGETEESYISL